MLLSVVTDSRYIIGKYQNERAKPEDIWISFKVHVAKKSQQTTPQTTLRQLATHSHSRKGIGSGKIRPNH